MASLMSPNDLLGWQQSGFQKAIGEVTGQLNIVESLSAVVTKVAEVNEAYRGASSQAHAAETKDTVGRIAKVVAAGRGILTILHEKSARLAKCKQQLENLTLWSVNLEKCIKNYSNVTPPFVVPNPARTTIDPAHPARTANLNTQISAIMAEANRTDLAGYIKIGAHLADLALALAPEKKAEPETKDDTKQATPEPTTPGLTGAAQRTPVASAPTTTVSPSTVLAGVTPTTQPAGAPLSGIAAAAAGSAGVRPVAGAPSTPAVGGAGVGGIYGGVPLAAGSGDRRRATTAAWELDEEDQVWAGRAVPTDDGVLA